MEQVGASGLPPLLPAVPVPVAVAVGDPEQAVEQDLCSLTELVPVRSQQPTTASDRILASDVPREETTSTTPGSGSENGESPVGGATPSHNTERELSTPTPSVVEESPVRIEVSSGTPTFQVPPHLLGRTVENPAADIPPGRRMQKPRLGVRVPYRNLTSQIVTQNEIAQEIFERSQKKHPYVENISEAAVPGRITTGDLFTRKLTQRLASSISPQATKPKIAAVPESIGTLKALLPNKAAALVDGVRLSPGFTYSEKEKATLDDAELLSILEGDGEPLWLPDKLLRKVEGASATPSVPATPPPATPAVPPSAVTPANPANPNTPAAPANPATPAAPPPATTCTPANPSAHSASVSTTPPTPSQPQSQPAQPSPPKLDPALEKELALKQLEELPIKFPPKKPDKKDRPPTARKRKVQVKKEIVEESEELTGARTTVELTPALLFDGAAAVAAATEIVTGKGAVQATVVEPAAPVNGVVITEGTNNTTMPDKKPPSTRKRKLSPDVAAVLKKPKLTKKAEAVANGKVKAAKKPATPAVAKKKGGKKVTAVKVEPGTVVTNGNVGAANKKKVVKKVAKGKNVPVAPKKTTSKTTPAKSPASNKTAKTTPKTANKTTTQKQIEQEKEEGVDIPEKKTEEAVVSGKATEEEEPPTLEPNVEINDVEMAEESSSNTQKVAEPQPVPSVSQPPAVQPQKKSKISRELEYLLGDEGAVNMLYAVEGQGNKRKTSSQDLALKARLVKTAVMRLSTGPQGHVPLALRARRSLNVTEPPKLVKMGTKRKQRQLSSESHDSMRSPPYLTPVETITSHMYSPRQKLTADASRIIRRHSSSSTFSSPSVSPRRASVEDSKDDITSAAATSGTSATPARKKGIPIFVRDAAKSLTYSGKKKAKVMNPVALDSALHSENARKLLELQCNEIKAKKPTLLPNPAALKKKDLKKISVEVKKKVKSEMFKNFKKGIDNAAALATKKAVRLQKAQMAAEKKAAEEMAKAQKAAEELMKTQREVEELAKAQADDGRATSPPPVLRAAQHIKREGGKSAPPLSPDASSYSNLIKTLDQKGKRLQVEDRQRATARHCAGTYNYRELTVRRYDNVVHIILAPVSTKIRCALNIQVLRELRDALQQVRKDDSCRVVLLTSSGSAFCLGVDVATLLHSNVDKRKTAAIELTLALKDFMKCVASFPKPLVAGVNGAAVGLGVTMLPLFDMVFASDKATFHTPYSQLGQVPEGGATLTLPYMLGHTATSELLLNCRKLTANEALQYGLVTRILWPDKFLEELVPVVKKIAMQSAQSMEATKALLRHGLRTKFDAALESETHLLVTHWTSQECQNHFRRWVEEDQLGPEPQPVPDT